MGVNHTNINLNYSNSETDIFTFPTDYNNTQNSWNDRLPSSFISNQPSFIGNIHGNFGIDSFNIKLSKPVHNLNIDEYNPFNLSALSSNESPIFELNQPEGLGYNLPPLPPSPAAVPIKYQSISSESNLCNSKKITSTACSTYNGQTFDNNICLTGNDNNIFRDMKNEYYMSIYNRCNNLPSISNDLVSDERLYNLKYELDSPPASPKEIKTQNIDYLDNGRIKQGFYWESGSLLQLDIKQPLYNGSIDGFTLTPPLSPNEPSMYTNRLISCYIPSEIADNRSIKVQSNTLNVQSATIPRRGRPPTKKKGKDIDVITLKDSYLEVTNEEQSTLNKDKVQLDNGSSLDIAKEIEYLISSVVRKNSKNGYECPYNGCTKVIKYRWGLKSHIQTHYGERRHICSICGSGFMRRNDMQRHLKRHTGDRPHRCQICGRTFSRSDALKKHITSEKIDKKLNLQPNSYRK